MKRIDSAAVIALIVTAFVGLQFLAEAKARPMKTQFYKTFKRYLKDPSLQPSPQIKANVRKDQFFLISGNGAGGCRELKRDGKVLRPDECFGPLREVVRKSFGMEVPDTAIFYSPDDKNKEAISQAADRIYRRLLRQYQTGGKKKILVIAHSMGGPEIFLALLRHPKLLGTVVDRVLISSGAICGSLTDPGVQSLEKKNLVKQYRSAFKKYWSNAYRPQFNSRVFFSTLEAPGGNPQEGDTVIRLSWQTPAGCFPKLANVGTLLDQLVGKHCTFFCGGKLNNRRKAYFQAIVQTMRRKEAPVPDYQLDTPQAASSSSAKNGATGR